VVLTLFYFLQVGNLQQLNIGQGGMQMNFFDGIQNIENVRHDLRQYFEKDFMPWYIANQKTDEDRLYNIVELSLILAKEMHLDANMCFAIACMHDLGEVDEAEDNNFNILMSVKTDQNLVRFFLDFEIELISNACKEHDGNSQELGTYSSLYSKMINDAIILSVLRIEPMLRHYWKSLSKENPKGTDKEIFDRLYRKITKRYGRSGSEKLLLSASKELIKDELEKTHKILDSEKETKHMFLQLAKYHEVSVKRDGTLLPDPVVTKKEILVDDDNLPLFEDFEASLFNESDEVEILTEATTSKSPRQQTEELIYRVLTTLDPTGVNVKKYKEFFGKMSNEQFDKYMKKFIKDEDENFYLEILPNVNEPSMEQIKKALDILKVPTDEYVYLRHDGHKDDPIRTAYKVPVGYITIRRLQQILSKKNTYSLDIAQRNMKTGQVTGDDKVARISDIESYSLVAIGADAALKEFLGARADNASAKTDMYKDINMFGYTYLKDMSKDITENQTLNTLYVHLMGAGLANDLLKEDVDLEELLGKNVEGK
jgi:hypothetical protein